MTPEAKRALSTTIRLLRVRLLSDLHDATEAAYRLAVRTRDAGLDEAARTRRARFEAWVAEQLRAQNASDTTSNKLRTAENVRGEAEKQAAYTLLNRLVILRLMEAAAPTGEPLRGPAVVTGGWESQAYKDFRQVAPALVQGDDTEGYALLLQLVFEDLAIELPGLYGPVGVADLVPIPAATLRHVVEELDKPELESCWTDDMTLGWVYQYWNDPEREAIDDKLNAGGKLEPHEIASKTQLFTERYMVDWLLQNSLGPMWLAMCKKHGWIPKVEADGTLQRLEERRAEWRAKRDAGEVSLTELMPLNTDTERRWAYYVPQPIPDDSVTHASGSVRELKILDPAVGSGHFLVVATDLLVALYREEACHRGVHAQPEWTDRAIVERILSYNLHGIDLDPRAVQIAAAALWLKARQMAPEARPERLNLVASNLRLASLPDDDPALIELRLEVERETSIPGELTDTIVHALRGADHLGSLLKVDRAVDQAIETHEAAIGTQFDPQQVGMFEAPPPRQGQIAFEAAAARRSLVDRLETFLFRHTTGDDLGLRLRGEQLAAGVRFVRLVREGAYDLVVANPPYQGTSKMLDANYVDEQYPLGKADLFAAFLLRGLQLVREGGVSAMLTMRKWMFINQYGRQKGDPGLREHLLETFDLRVIGDFDRGAFEDVRDEVVSVAVSVFRRSYQRDQSLAVCPTPRDDRSRDSERTQRKRAATLCHVGRYEFDPVALRVVPEWPLVYWWDQTILSAYAVAPRLGRDGRIAQGISTTDDNRFFRRPWEVDPFRPIRVGQDSSKCEASRRFVPLIKGAAGRVWIEPLDYVCRWAPAALAIRTIDGAAFRSPDTHFAAGVAYVAIGANFRARWHRYRSVCQNMGTSIFKLPLTELTCALNSNTSAFLAQSLNPGMHFEVGDAQRLPFIPPACSDAVGRFVEEAFTSHESHREPSIEFKRPGPSPWRQAQQWAQFAVDRPHDAPLPMYEAEYDPEPPTDHVSFALGVAMGRLDVKGEGVLDPRKDDLSHTLPGGLLFLDGTLEGNDMLDSLGHPAAAPLHEAWVKDGETIETKRGSLREWLAHDFFKDVHQGMYDNRPIYWPLSSATETFVVWVNSHRFTQQTLRILLADHLNPTLNRIEGELNDLRNARDAADKKAARAAEKQYDRALKARDELQAFITDVEQCSDCGAPPTDAKCPPRERDGRYDPDLDDGVMINAAALWPLLEPQWKDPKKWWKQLSEAKGKKDYDWSHVAMRYWPTRVDEKCQRDPSLGVAHGCFWRYHAGRAWSWELRLQDEIDPDFRIDEGPYRPGARELGDLGSGSHRGAWLRDHALEALAAVEREAVRRMRRSTTGQLACEIRILETGLWSALPDDVWKMELRLSEKRGAEFRLLTPEESEARAAYETAHPDRVKARALFIASLVPPDYWAGEASDEDEGIADDEEIEEADVDIDVEAES